MPGSVLSNAVKGIHVERGKKCVYEESRIWREGFRGAEYDFQKYVFSVCVLESCKLRLSVFKKGPPPPKT